MILLDTHILVWLRFGDRRLGPQSRLAVDRALSEGDAAVSTITFWEVGMRIQKGRLDLRTDIHAWRRDLLSQGLNEIPVTSGIAIRAGLLAELHGDPADRIIATAMEGHRLMTADQSILEWPGQLRRLRATD